MFTLKKRVTFEASHQLPNHDGKCARLHGHSWGMVITVRGGVLQTQGPKEGMLLDYGDVKAAVEPFLTNFLDHWHLNETTGLYSPTSELLARWVFKRLKPSLPLLHSVAIEETCTCSAEYTEP